MDVLYISFNQDMTREYIDTCAEWAKKLQIVAGKVNEDIFRDWDEREIKAFRIDLPAGTRYLRCRTGLPTCAASRGASS